MPIIKFVETTSNLAFDISFDVANGPQAAESVRQLMHELPPMKPLVLVLKIFLQQREFNEVGHLHRGPVHCIEDLAWDQQALAPPVLSFASAGHLAIHDVSPASQALTFQELS